MVFAFILILFLSIVLIRHKFFRIFSLYLVSNFKIQTLVLVKWVRIPHCAATVFLLKTEKSDPKTYAIKVASEQEQN